MREALKENICAKGFVLQSLNAPIHRTQHITVKKQISRKLNAKIPPDQV